MTSASAQKKRRRCEFWRSQPVKLFLAVIAFVRQKSDSSTLSLSPSLSLSLSLTPKPSAVFKMMLQIRLCLVLEFTENLDRCKCGMQSDTGMQQGRHWMTKCPKAHRGITHNKMRHVVAAIYRALHVHVTVEVRGLDVQLTSYGEHKPADMLVPASATGTDKATALDITITDPTNKTTLDRGSDRKPLVAAAGRHTVWGHTRKHSRRQGTKVSRSRRDP